MQIPLAYGRGILKVELPDDRTTVIEPRHQPGLSDERAAIFAAMDAPVKLEPLRQQAMRGKRVTIVHSDITRPMPNERVIPWLLEYLEAAGVRREDITLLNGLGTHRTSPY
jgi:nickel-dependent lactate racemase